MFSLHVDTARTWRGGQNQVLLTVNGLRSIGHRAEWIQACKDNKPEDARAGFAYSGPFTEALLVGNLATRLGKKIQWDSANLRAVGTPEAEALIRKQYRPGFGIEA